MGASTGRNFGNTKGSKPNSNISDNAKITIQKYSMNENGYFNERGNIKTRNDRVANKIKRTKIFVV